MIDINAIIPLAIIVITLIIVSLICGKTRSKDLSEDKVNKMGCKWLMGSAAVTLAGGLYAVILDNSLLYILALILPTVIAALVVVIYKLKKKEIKLDKPVIIIFTIISLIFVGISLIPVFSEGKTYVEVTSDNIDIYGMYGEDIPVQEIMNITLTDSIPEIKYRSNGYSQNDVNIGDFKTAGNRTVKLFMRSGETPFILIRRIQGCDIYINRKNAAETNELYSLMKKTLHTPRRQNLFPGENL